MHEYTSIIINSFHLFKQSLFNKGLVVEGGGGPERGNNNKQGEGRGYAYLCAYPVKKIA